MRFVFPLTLVALGLTVLLASEARAQTPGLIFHLPFDGNPDARQAGGRRQPLAGGKLAYQPGVIGQAVAIPANASLEYAAEGNLMHRHGTISLWFKPKWRAGDMGMTAKDWHCLFQERLPQGKERVGSGVLWFWFWGPLLRGDISDKDDLYKTAGSQGIDRSTWVHLAFTWDIERGSRLYMNGIPVGAASDGSSPLDLKKGRDFTSLANTFNSFYVGSQGGWAGADGLIDELRIFDRALSPAQIAADMATVAPLRLDCLDSYATEPTAGDDGTRIRWRLTNASARPVDGSCSWQIIRRADGNVVAQSPRLAETQQTSLAPGKYRELAAQVRGLSKGQYRLFVRPARGPQRSAAIWVLGRDNPYLKPPGKIETALVETIDLVKGLPANRLIVRGTSRTHSLAGRSYYEAGPQKNDRFAVKVTLPEAGVPYLIEWDYPDDKLRTMEMIAQNAKDPSDDYGLQTGVFCGDEYPNSMQTLTHRSILWARSKDTAFIFMTARADAPAAVSALRISKINGGLPDGNVRDAAPVGGWGRTVGLHFEDPSLGYDFGIPGQLMPDYERALDRLIAYMKWSGQNLLSYPAVWYHGRIGPAYQPRPHEDDFIGCILAKFAAHDLGFMPAINLQNIDLPEQVTINEKTFADGSLHATPVMILANGQPNPGGWHGTPPNFNPLHPSVQEYVNRQVDDLLDRYATSPAFKGIVLHLTKHTIPWFGSVEAGYNDYCIDAFEKETGIRVPVDRQTPLRGKLYHDWLMAHAREPWIQWRCRQIAQWYKAIADRISARRPDLKLTIFSYSPTVTDFAADPRYGSPGFALAINRESGLDPKLYEGASNIILSQTIYPADYRAVGPEVGPAHKAVREEHAQAGTYAILDNVQLPWVNMHDRYFEDGIGGQQWWGKVDPLKADWLKETPWRVSTLNPNPRYFLEHYVLPLRYGDVLGFTKGGFLIGTAGVEQQLLEFSRAFRALPAQRFADLSGSTDTMKARVLKTPQGTWFYAVNTGREAVSVSFLFDRPPGAVTNLGAGQAKAPNEARYTVALSPYQLASFRMEGPASLTSVVCGSGAR